MGGLAKLKLTDVGPAGNVLCLGAHCDDIEIGCGATLVDLVTRWPDLAIHVVIFSSDNKREMETRKSLAELLGEETGVIFHFGRLKDAYLPYLAEEAKDFLIEKVGDLKPDLVFTHCRQDFHQDHRFIGEITYQVLRDNFILEMEIPKYDGDLGRPNVFVPVSKDAMQRKTSALLSAYASQSKKKWFREEMFMAISRLRGLECSANSGLAEAFYCNKVVIS